MKLGTIPFRRLLDQYREPPTEAIQYYGSYALVGLVAGAPVFYQHVNDIPYHTWAVGLPIVTFVTAAFWAGMSLRNDTIFWDEPDFSVLNQLNAIPAPITPDIVQPSATLQDTLDAWDIPAKVVRIMTSGKTLDVAYLQVKRGHNITKTRLDGNFSRDMQLNENQLVTVQANAGQGMSALYIPKAVRGEVTLKDAFKKLKKPYTFTAGETVTGEYPVFSAMDMTHVLWAGTSGSGKSVGMNSTILQVAATTSPSLLKFTFIDPKKVELRDYAALPHNNGADIITDTTQAYYLLKEVERQMNEREQLIADAGCRSLQEYNKKHPRMPLPLWVVVIEELVSLALDDTPITYTAKGFDEDGNPLTTQVKSTAGKAILQVLKLLLSEARAVGVRFWFGAQRLGSDEFPPLIRDNIMHYCAFQTKSAGASAVALGESGNDACTKLMGKGDMICGLDPNNPVRMQGVNVGSKQIRSVVRQIRLTHENKVR